MISYRMCNTTEVSEEEFSQWLSCHTMILKNYQNLLCPTSQKVTHMEGVNIWPVCSYLQDQMKNKSAVNEGTAIESVV